MRILILGGDGMLGHQLLQSLQANHDVRVTLRQDAKVYVNKLFNINNSFFGIDVRRLDDLSQVLAEFHPQIVINAVGIVKQRKDAKSAIPSLEINALFPHRLAVLCDAIKARMIHISTDCVFSGKKGNYTEEDFSDAEDLYGKTKYLGETDRPNCLTLRTSIIGLEISRKTSLIEWFLAQTGTIKGYQKAFYTGLTTQEMSRLIEHVILKHPDLSGIWHVSSDNISKYELLKIFAEILQRKDITIEADNNFICDRSLNSSRFRKVIGYQPPAWPVMLKELADQFKQKI